MITATLTSKGQITLPKAIRETLRLRTGDRIGFQLLENGEAVITPVSKSVSDVYGCLHDPDREALTVTDMNKALAARFKITQS
jgi:antitoxin PrlF